MSTSMPTINERPTLGKKVCAYISAVIIASLLPMLIRAIDSINSMSDITRLLRPALLVWFVMLCFFNFIFSIIPFIVGSILAAKKRTKLLIPLNVGGIIGIAMAGLVSLVDFGPAVQGDAGTHMMQSFVVLLPVFLFSGVVAGTVYWAILGDTPRRRLQWP